MREPVGKKNFASFHWIESWTETVDEQSGEPSGMTLTLPDWLFKGVVERGGVLSISEDYFVLTGGFERWLYRAIRRKRARYIRRRSSVYQAHEPAICCRTFNGL